MVNISKYIKVLRIVLVVTWEAVVIIKAVTKVHDRV